MLDSENLAFRDILLHEGGCSEEQLRDVEEEHDRSGKSFFEEVVNFGLVTKNQALQLIADNIGSEVVDIEAYALDPAIIRMVKPEIARAYGAVPMFLDGETLQIALRSPLNFMQHDELRFILNRDIQVLVADPEQVDSQVEKYYPLDATSVSEIISQMSSEIKNIMDDDIRNLEDNANAAPIIRFVDTVLAQAIKDEASDIHFEPYENDFRIRYRVDGALYELPPPPKELALAIISRIKVMANLDISERRIPQDGRIQLRTQGKPIDLRVSCLPITHGESVVLRVLDRTVVNLDLDALGLDEKVLAKLREVIHLPNGILLVTGPTGSGKTTTLYSALKEINVIGDKLLTAEDPVEYDIEGIIQVPINEAVGMTFHKALRAFLRQDPDRILVGEIRDFETAQTAIEASLTGHFVFSTLHTNDSASTITRLVDMGIEPFLICSSLVGVLAQRLIRRVCYNCKTPYVPSDEELKRLGVDRSDIGDHKFYYGRGCPVCNNTGYKGRKAITELLMITQPIIDLILDNAPTPAIQEKGCQQGMKTIREDGIQAILNGETTVDEVLRYT